MADLREADMSRVTDCEYVRILDSQGNSTNISISNLKTLLLYPNHITAIVDCDSIKISSVISAYKWENAPSAGIAILEVLLYSPDWLFQRFTLIGTVPRMWIRCWYDGDKWGPWTVANLIL